MMVKRAVCLISLIAVKPDICSSVIAVYLHVCCWWLEIKSSNIPVIHSIACDMMWSTIAEIGFMSHPKLFAAKATSFFTGFE
jgi:hypothetical protein